MFTGIVQGVVTVSKISVAGDVLTLTLKFPDDALAGVVKGGSISINGCCLTVVTFDEKNATFDLVQETVKRTNFSQVKLGDQLHFERSLKLGDELGGHLLSGHIDTTGKVSEVIKLAGSMNVVFRVPPEWIKYILPKGYISVMGASLTVVDVYQDTAQFLVALIPETLKITTFGDISEGDLVNIEIDRSTQVIVDTVERVLKNQRTS
jgi:riboflavin synthase